MERGTDEARNLLEAEWLDAAMIKSRDWKAYKNTQRDYVCRGRQFVAWELADEAPRIIEIFRVDSVGVSWEEGLTFVLSSLQTDRQYTVTSRPRAVVGGVFMWIPGFADIRFNPMQYTQPGSVRRLTLPIVYRTAHSTPRPRARSFSSMKDFKALWPGIL